MVKQLYRKLFPKLHALEEVFTPSSSAKLTFIARKDIDNQLDKALLIPGMQIVVYGHSGSGKTTLTQNHLNHKKQKFLITNCILDTSINEILLDAFDRLDPFFTSERVKSQSAAISAEISSGYKSLKAAIKSEIKQEATEKLHRVLPPQLTPQRLAEFIGASGAIWIIEDFHKVQKEEREKFSQILKIFVDTSNKYNKIKVIAIGAVGTGRDVVNYDTELANRISEIHVPLMNKDEILGIIEKGEKLLNVEFGYEIKEKVLTYSNSLASICHHLCFSICYSNGIKLTQKKKIKFKPEAINDAIVEYIKQNSDSFKETIDRALKPRDGKFDNTRGILAAFCKLEKEDLTKKEILDYKVNKKTYKNDIDEYLKLLTTAEYGEILRYDENSGKFSFSDPFFRAFVRMKFSTEEKESTKISTKTPINVEDILKFLQIARDVELQIESPDKRANRR